MSKTRIAIAVVVVANLIVGGLYMAGVVGGTSTEIDRIYGSPPEDATRVLFVGNSHVFTHDVPGQLARLGRASDRPFWVEQVAVGGATLSDHRQSERAERVIRTKNWDFVVLQDSSLRPYLSPRDYLVDLEYFAKLVAQNGGVPVIYATWARAPWSDLYDDPNVSVTPSTLRARLNTSFREAHRRTRPLGARLAPVGSAWFAFRRQNATTPLHVDDGNHATPAGAYLAAAVFYRVLTDRPALDADYVPSGLGADLARTLRRTADEAPEVWDQKRENARPTESEKTGVRE